MEARHSERQYEKPKITTYTEDDILELIGPACTIGSDNGLHRGWEIGKGNPHR